MKVRERRMIAGGMGGEHAEYRVRELAADEEPPAGTEVVPDETPEHDWQPR